MTRTLQMLLLLCCLLVAACAGSSANLREEFDKSARNYNKMLRWHEVPDAGRAFMVDEGREAFLKSAERFRKQGVTITDYRILTMECLPDKGTGDVVAEFDYYILPSNRIRTLTYQQEWVYHRTNEAKSWKLKSVLPLFE
ncbi:hypothetical protein [Geobacter sp. SVR]|uniref:hypothetical protein n=1 Tax=Geobacter sp. SVR TaxID=2495594 RepID=UPI00143EFD22|nr:hypothetical protein [Geobacter sp. SVR]BCS51753.1 hypothetical protein GSVR_00610 [Geobacter sp. SVR]GCF84940.1 lipoprotein [Geobacter sp. SVR]